MSKRGRNEGTISRITPTRWVARISNDGKREAYSGKTRSEASDKLAAALKRKRDGLPLLSQRLTVGAYLTKWIAGQPSQVRPNTYRGYEVAVRCHLIPRLGRIPLAKLVPSDLTKMYADMLAGGRVAGGRRAKAPGLSPRSVGHAHRILGRALRAAEETGLVGRNVCRLVHPPRVPHAEMATLTAEQARALIHAAEGSSLHALYVVALSSGGRRGELLGLRWADVDMEAGSIRITRTLVRGTRPGERQADGPPKVEWSFAEPKTSSSRRTITIGRTALEALRLHRKVQTEERLGAGRAWQDGDLVFPSAFGTPIDGSNLLKAHYALLKQAGLPHVRFHDLRHSAATLLLEAGVQPHAVAQRLGHATPSLVMNTYGHVTDRMQQQATAAMDAALTG